MKSAKFDRKKIVKTAQPRRAGVPVRSGVKAGRDFGSGRRGGESELGRGGRDTDIPGRLG